MAIFIQFLESINTYLRLTIEKASCGYKIHGHLQEKKAQNEGEKNKIKKSMRKLGFKVFKEN